MATARISGYRPGLVNLRTGQISREIFVNDEIYQQELERVFVRAWLLVGHESQIPNPGDFFVSSMGEESVILCRDRAHKIHVFLNSCRHRGMKVCRYDEGKETLTRRVRQIQTGIHWAEEPVSRISHLISNIQLVEVNPSSADPAEVSVRCRFLVYRNRVETETDILVGKREDLLRRAGADWQIAHRKILLDQNVLLSKNLTFFF